ncbi:MAG: hypothetical protein ACKVOB_00400 [Sphingomonas sp.]
MPPRSPATRNLWLERWLGRMILAALAWVLLTGVYAHHLPPPMYYFSGDRMMDWFNTAFWARDAGMYDNWGSIYPPLSFLLLRLLGDTGCYPAFDGVAARACDTAGMLAIHALYVLDVVLIARAFLKIDRATAVPRAIALSAGLPLVYALDRGNLMLACVPCVVLGVGPLCRASWARAAWVGAALNFKVYLLGAVVAQIAGGKWRRVERALIAAVGVYLVSFALLGLGTPGEIAQDLIAFGSGDAPRLIDLWYPSSFVPLRSLLIADNPQLLALLGPDVGGALIVGLPWAVHAVQLCIVAALAAAWIRPGAVPTYRLAGLGAALALISVEAGGYAQWFVLFFVMIERWEAGFGAKWAILTCYALCMPLDIVLAAAPQGAGFPPLTLGHFLRPAMLASIPLALSLETLARAWRTLRAGRAVANSTMDPLAV